MTTAQRKKRRRCGIGEEEIKHVINAEVKKTEMVLVFTEDEIVEEFTRCAICGRIIGEK